MHLGTSGAILRRPLEFLARSIRGIEWIVAAEIESRLAVRRILLGHRQIRFVTDTTPSLADLKLSSADDAFLMAGDFEGIDHTRDSLKRFAKIAYALPWTRTLGELRHLTRNAGWSTFTIAASALGRRNYTRYEIEDRMAEGLQRALGLPYRPTKAPRQPGSELAIRVHLVHSGGTVAVRLFDLPLHRRRYRRDTSPGALPPPLAAATAMLAGLRPQQRVLDPFTGAGTVAIEARRLGLRLQCCGSDISRAQIRAARKNARRARAPVPFAQADAAHLPWADGTFDRVVTNVPWGRAVEPMGGLSLVPEARDREIARVLDRAGRAVLIVDEDDPLCLGGMSRFGLTLQHRSWLSVRGQHPRLCVLSKRDSSNTGPIDIGGLWGTALARWYQAAETRET